MITIYGIPNCDTCRKARKWLTAGGLEHRFHDFRKDGLQGDKVSAWSAAVGWEKLLNRRGTTWRQLPESAKTEVSETSAIALMTENPTLIKRPVFEDGKNIYVGFDSKVQQSLKQ